MAHTLTSAKAMSGRQSASTSRSAFVGGVGTTSGTDAKLSSQKLENTYKIAPDRNFPVMETKALVEDILRTELVDKVYDPKETNQLTLSLANKIKQQIRNLGYRRYRIITFVAIGEKNLATINVASRCVWNQSCDQFVEGTYSNKSLYAVGLVYAIYQE